MKLKISLRNNITDLSKAPLKRGAFLLSGRRELRAGTDEPGNFRMNEKGCLCEDIKI